MIKIQVDITKEVLRESMYCKSVGIQEICMMGQNCAIGKAIFNLFGNISWVRHGFITIYRGGLVFERGRVSGESYASIRLPIEATHFIKKFDTSSPAERLKLTPFSFDIEVPDEVIELCGGVDEVNEILKNSKTLQLA